MTYQIKEGEPPDSAENGGVCQVNEGFGGGMRGNQLKAAAEVAAGI